MPSQYARNYLLDVKKRKVESENILYIEAINCEQNYLLKPILSVSLGPLIYGYLRVNKMFVKRQK